MTTPTPKVGDLVTIRGLDLWADCVMVVEEVRAWGCIGVVHGPNGMSYPLRVNWSEIDDVFSKQRVMQ